MTALGLQTRLPCTPAERASLQTYLSRTAFPQLATYIERGAVVERTEVGPSSAVGTLRTTWPRLGGIESKKEYGLDRFLVQHVMTVLRRPDCRSSNVLETINRYIDLLASGTLEVKITLVDWYGKLAIWDGTKRAVAWYERESQRGDSTSSIPVFVVHISRKVLSRAD